MTLRRRLTTDDTRIPNVVAQSTLPISSGAVTATSASHVLAAESGTTDDLDTLNLPAAWPVGNSVDLVAAPGHTITIKNGTGNIACEGGDDLELSGLTRFRAFKTASGVEVVQGGGKGIEPYTTAERTALSLDTGNEGLTVYDTDEDKLYSWDGTAWVLIAGGFADEAELLAGTEDGKAVAPDVLRPFFTGRKPVTSDTVWGIGPGQEFADEYEALDGVATADTVGRNLLIIEPPTGVIDINTQLYLTAHKFTGVRFGSNADADRRQNVTLAGVTGSTGAYEFTFNIPGAALVVGQTFWINPSGTIASPGSNSGPYWQCAGGFVVKSIPVAGQYTVDVPSQVAGLEVASIVLSGADAYVQRTTYNMLGTVNPALNATKNPAQTEIHDRENNLELVRNLLMNPDPSTADDQGVFHSNVQDSWLIWDIGINLSNIAGINDEDRQEHCLRAAYGGSLKARNVVGVGAPKGFALATDGGLISIENSGFSGCNRSNKSADGMYSQLGGYVRANTVNGGHQAKAAARAREDGFVAAQNCKLTGCDFAVDAEHHGSAQLTGDGRGNAIAGGRAINNGNLYLVRYTELTDNPISIIADKNSRVAAEGLQKTDGGFDYLGGDSGVDIQVEGGADVTLANTTGLTISSPDGRGSVNGKKVPYLSGTVTTPGSNTAVDVFTISSLAADTVYEIYVTISATDAGAPSAHWLGRVTMKGSSFLPVPIAEQLLTDDAALGQFRIQPTNSASQNKILAWYVQEKEKLI